MDGVLKKRLIRNALVLAFQNIIMAGLMFLLYRYLIATLGLKLLGVWSLVMAMTSASQMAQMGVTGSVVKFVAKHAARGDQTAAAHVVETAVLSIGFLFTVILLCMFPVLDRVIPFIVETDSVAIARQIMPYAFLAFWLIVVTGVIQAGLDGFQKMDVRSSLIIFNELFHLILCFFIVPEFGLFGVAYSRIILNGCLLIINLCLLKKFCPAMPLVPRRWNLAVFKEIVVYGAALQVSTLCSMTYEPVTKSFLSRFGGLETVALYEIANRMVKQLRGMVIMANSAVVPAIANLKETFPEKIKVLYERSYDVVLIIGLVSFSMLIVLSPILSSLLLSRIDGDFIQFLAILCAVWMINLISTPAYFVNVGTGELKWNVYSHMVTASLNAILGLTLGILFGSNGVVVGWFFAMTSGSVLLFISFVRRYGVEAKNLLPMASRTPLIVCLCTSTASLALMTNNTLSSHSRWGVISFFSLLIFASAWFHPFRTQLMAMLRQKKQYGV